MRRQTYCLYVSRCDGCGFEYHLGDAIDAPQGIVSCIDELASLLSTGSDGITARPSREIWSPHEYGCHVRDVLLVQRERVLAACFIDRPSFNPMGRDERVELDGY